MVEPDSKARVHKDCTLLGQQGGGCKWKALFRSQPDKQVFALIVFSALMYTVERGDWYPESVVLRILA